MLTLVLALLVLVTGWLPLPGELMFSHSRVQTLPMLWPAPQQVWVLSEVRCTNMP